MAWFGTKEENKKAKAQKTAPAKSASVQSERLAPRSSSSGVAHVLQSPRITEKATMHQQTGVYTFDVATSATKPEIVAAVRAVYKVTPRKVRIVTIAPKQTRSMRNGRRGMRAGGKKAYVYLKSGETITIA